jgi:hypothetical protein
MHDELIKRLREPCQYENCILCQQAADAIEELQGRVKVLEKVADKWCAAVPKWIPVTERLPKRGKNVLVANKRGKQWDVDKAWLSCLGSGFDRGGKRSLYHVTHWMPLPEPPKEET